MSGIEAAAQQVQEAVAAGTQQAIEAAQQEQEREAAIESAQLTASEAGRAAFDAQARYDELAGRLGSIEAENSTWREQSEARMGNLEASLSSQLTQIQETISSSLRSSQPGTPTVQAATVEVQAATPAEDSPPPGDGSPASDAPILSPARDQARGGFRSRVLRRSARA